MSLIDYTNKIKNIDKSITKKKDNIEYINLQISKDVKLARVQKGLTQAQLAKKIGTKQTSISRLESGKASPSVSFLNEIAIALDTKLITPTFTSIQDVKKKKGLKNNFTNTKAMLSIQLRDKGESK